MRFLCASAFVADPNSGAPGTIISIGNALAARGHVVDYLWRPAEPFRVPHPSLAPVLELPTRQYRQVDAHLQKHHYDVVVVSQPYAHPVYEKLPLKYPSTLFVNRTHGWEERFNDARVRFGWDMPAAGLRRAGIRLSQ